MGYYEEIVPYDGFFLENIALCKYASMYTGKRSVLKEMLNDNLSIDDFPGCFLYRLLPFIFEHVKLYEYLVNGEYENYLFINDPSILKFYQYRESHGISEIVSTYDARIDRELSYFSDYFYGSDVLNLTCPKKGTFGYCYIFLDCCSYYGVLSEIVDLLNIFYEFESKYMVEDENENFNDGNKRAQ